VLLSRFVDKVLVNFYTDDGHVSVIVLENFSCNTTITTSNNKDSLRIRVCHHGDMRDHLVVDKLITLCDVEDIIEPKHIAPPLVLGLYDLSELRSLLFIRQGLFTSLGLLSNSLKFRILG
jgi:hypothetical protein